MKYQFYNPYTGKYQTVGSLNTGLIFDQGQWTSGHSLYLETINPNNSEYKIKLSHNFNLNELVCKCGCGFFSYEAEFIEQLQRVRFAYGQPMIVSSGCRCYKHNLNVGGANTSDHLHGFGIDVLVNNDRERYRIIEAVHNTKFTRIGVAGLFLHLGIGKPFGLNAPDLIWRYR